MSKLYSFPFGSMVPAPLIVALDFETANTSADSACQLGLVRIEDWNIVRSKSWLIRPPTDEFCFTYLHGIALEDVANQPRWKGLWPEIAQELQGADFLAAHNARFDRGVLEASCLGAGIPAVLPPFLDTVTIARRVWNIFPTKLNLVCEKLSIPLNHHEALSDAQACAQILVRAHQEGWNPEP